jgi:hypothetical protein
LAVVAGAAGKGGAGAKRHAGSTERGLSPPKKRGGGERQEDDPMQ